MSLGIVPVGVCKGQIDTSCPSLPDGATSVVVCDILNIDHADRVEDVSPIQLPGGVPGQDCFYLELPNKDLPSEIGVDTCGGISPIWNAVTGRMDYTKIANADGVINGILLQQLKEDANCFCACETATTNCRISLTLWSKGYCRSGQSPTFHPGGQWWVQNYPALEYQKVSQTRSLTNTAAGSERFTFYAYTRPGYQGPGNIIPPEAADKGYTACWYGFTSAVCPPGDDCSCGNCDGTDPVTPLARAARASRQVAAEMATPAAA